MGTAHRRRFRVLALALAAVWVVTLAFADTAVTPAMHCQRGHMPCCPQNSNGESCSSAQCTEQVPEKAESQGARVKESETAVVPAAGVEAAARRVAEPMHELSLGLRYQASVFRLKDDLRI